jgi:hypothetical protein
MNITSAQYENNPTTGEANTTIRFVEDGVTRHVSANAVGNRHYEEIMLQVEAGTLTIQDAD